MAALTPKRISDLDSASSISTTTLFETERAGIASEKATGQQLVDLVRNEVLPIASQAEAEAGTVNTKAMTPLRSDQQTDARLASQAEVEAGTNADKLMTPLRVQQAGYTPSQTGGVFRTFSQHILSKDRHILEFVSYTTSSDVTIGTKTEQIRDFLEDNNVTLRLPGGRTYHINVKNGVDANGFGFGGADLINDTIIGDGRENTLLYRDSGTDIPFMGFRTLTNCTIGGFTLDGNRANNNELGYHNFRLGHCDTFRLFDFGSKNSDTYGIGFQGISPPRTVLGANPLTTFNGTKTVRVAHAAHGFLTGNGIQIENMPASLNGLNNFRSTVQITAVPDANSWEFLADLSAGNATSSGTGGGSGIEAGKYTYFFQGFSSNDVDILATGADGFDAKNATGANRDWEMVNWRVRNHGLNSPSNLYAAIDVRGTNVRIIGPRIASDTPDVCGIRLRNSAGYDAAKYCQIIGADINMGQASNTLGIEVSGPYNSVLGGHLQGARTGADHNGSGIYTGSEADFTKVIGLHLEDNTINASGLSSDDTRFVSCTSRVPIVAATSFAARIKSINCSWGETGRPHVTAHQVVAQTNVTGDDTYATVIPDAETLDATAIYNNATGVATIVEAGNYRFSGRVTMTGIVAATHTALGLKILVNGATYALIEAGDVVGNTSTQVTIAFDETIACVADDTIAIQGMAAGPGPKDVSFVASIARLTSFNLRLLDN